MNIDIKKWRKSKHISCYAISKETGLRIETVENIERGVGKMESVFTYLHYIKQKDYDFFRSIMDAI